MNTGVGCHSLLQGNPHDPGIEPISLNVSYIIAGGFFTTALPRKPDISSWLDLNCASLVDTSQRWDCVLYGIIMCGAGLWIVPSLDKMAFARLLHQETTLLLSVINMYFLKLCLFIYLAVPGPTLKLQHENSQLQHVNPVLWPGMEPEMEPGIEARPPHPLAGSLESQPLDHQGSLNIYFEGGTENIPFLIKSLIQYGFMIFCFIQWVMYVLSLSVVSDSLWPCGL